MTEHAIPKLSDVSEHSLDLKLSDDSDDGLDLKSMSQSFTPIDKTAVENIIMGSKAQSDSLAETPETGRDCEENQSNLEKIIEDDSSEHASTKKSRELKSLLALSKEANLDTNILHKRKTLEGNKNKEIKTTQSDSDINISSKVATENTIDLKYPVTAEAELEESAQKNESNSFSDDSNKLKRKRNNSSEVNVGGATDSTKKNRKTFHGVVKMFKPNKDVFCWRCHREGVNVACETCPRSYHQKCLKQTINNPDHWPCPECVAILKAENTQTRSEAMKGMTLEHLCKLLRFAANRMIQYQGSEPFLHPVCDTEFPDYKKYIIQPMDLSLLLKNIKENIYGSTQAFEADAKWLLHNSIIFNSYQSKLTYAAKNVIKICKQEMAEIENCPNCYLNANTKKATWFVEVCPKPHLLIWAKLKGFPYWPAKAMCANSTGMVDVRFFGAHDRAWVHYKECFLYSEKDPNTFKQKRYDIEKCIKELNVYIENLRKAYGEFRYAPYRTPLEPNNLTKQLQIFLPKYRQSLPMRISLKDSLDSITEKEPKSDEESSPSKASGTESSSEKKETEIESINEFKEEITDNDSNVNSPENKNEHETTMEGYGTDDESIGEIYLERRKAFVGKRERKIEENEDDNDTQVPSNISIGSSASRGVFRSKGSWTNTSGKMKIASRRKSELENEQNHISTEDTYPSPQKLSRRNSDQSVKSDSSRLSNISDKISRVDISENMEITLGNDDGCISISENISSSNGESSRTGSDITIDHKRKPVQVDIDNAEISISPSSKRKISDQLIKRLSDGEKIEGVKKSFVEKKSPTDIFIQRFQDVVQNDYTPSSKTAVTADNAKQTGDEDMNADCSQVAKEDENSIKNDSPIQKSNVVENGVNSNNDNVQDSLSKSSTTGKTQKMIQPTITEFTSTTPGKNTKMITNLTRKSCDNVIEKESVSKIVEEEILNSESIEIVEEFQEERNSLDSIKIAKETIFNIIHSSLNQSKNIELTSEEKIIDNVKETVSKSEDKTQNSEGCSLDCDKETATPTKETVTSGTENQKIDSKISEEKKETPVDTDTNKKRKISCENQVCPPAKVVRLIPVERISNNTIEEKVNSDQSLENKPTQRKVVIRKLAISTAGCSSPSAPTITHTPTSLTCQEDIKSEPESDSDSNEANILEAKRKYLSALNISEKMTDSDKDKNSAIRTRAKAEEKREKFRIVDNLTRIIDDVALNYSAENEGKLIPSRKPEKKTGISDGEIFVKSFAKIQTPPPNTNNQRARKSFPTPSYPSHNIDKPTAPPVLNKKDLSASKVRKDIPKLNFMKKDVPTNSFFINNSSTTKTCSSAISVQASVSSSSTKTFQTFSNVIISEGTNVTASSISTSQAPLGIIQTIKPVDTSGNALPHVFLMPTSGLNYCVPIGNPVLTSVPVTPTSSSSMATQSVTQSVLRQPCIPPNLRASQNYIPQGDETNEKSSSSSTVSNSQQMNETPTSNPMRSSEQTSTSTSNNSNSNSNGAVVETQQEDEFAVLNSILPDTVSRAVSEILMRPPPKLKPRPPGVLNQVFHEGTPSSAGDVTSRINSIAHRMGDYFRGMLIETLEDLGKCANPEAKIVSLQLELEAEKHQHALEMTELRKNICIVLKDVQKSILLEREKVIDETRSACEAETIKRVELAKSKQWCANCSKEAQFYCCWNTSYCDYPCQQKHWPQHMGKCTQNIEKTNNVSSSPSRPSPIVLRPTGPPKPGRIISKPTKIYPRGAAPIKTYKGIATSNNQITVIETTPGSYELVGNGPVTFAGKTIVNSKLKPTNTASNVSSANYMLGHGSSGNTQRPTTSTSTSL